LAEHSSKTPHDGTSTPPFDPKTYWEKRLTRDFSLGSAGRLNWGIYYNRWQYRVIRKVFLRAVRDFKSDLESVRALDVGSGTGFYIERWQELGVKSITGLDLTTVAVEKLRQVYPKNTFYQLNVGDESARIPGGPYDIVSAMGVMFHIVDDKQYQKALENMFAALVPGGILVFSDLFLHRPERRFSYIVHRTLTTIEHMVRKAGFEPLERRPLFVLMNEPVDSGNLLLKLYWGMLQRIVNRFLWTGHVFGAVLYPLDSVLVSVVRESPATEIMVCRKPAS
jgi:SAM-dependent methyltransferase